MKGCVGSSAITFTNCHVSSRNYLDCDSVKSTVSVSTHVGDVAIGFWLLVCTIRTTGASRKDKDDHPSMAMVSSDI